MPARAARPAPNLRPAATGRSSPATGQSGPSRPVLARSPSWPAGGLPPLPEPLRAGAGTSHTLAAVPCLIQPRELGRDAFLAHLDRLNAVYAAAMRPDPALLPGRRDIMARHTRHAGFRALAMVCAAAPEEPAPEDPGTEEPSTEEPGPELSSGPARDSEIVAFAYGFRGEPGQWWHDVVRSALTAQAGQALAGAWLDDSMEVAEVHVHPDYQRRGLGQSMLLRLTQGRREQTAALSTPDGNWPARHLYGRLGFTDLLTGFSFPGGGPTYTVMGAVLPLRAAQPARRARPAGPA
jgi:ribosomal protein S18 acetylase RimI-like enzyme